MQILIFRSRKNLTIFGFTEDPDGANLPAEHAPWEAVGRGAMPISGGDSSDPVVAAITRDGYCVRKEFD
jgi:hypothetical protein